MRAIILAAGQGFLLDGMVKCLVRKPAGTDSLLGAMVKAFRNHEVTVVVGYRAVAVMEAFPELDFVYNPDWATCNNSYSLGLALDDRPSYVLSSDLVFEPPLVDELDASAPNLALTEKRENRILTSVNCALGEGEAISEFYVGPLRRTTDPEAVGIFKVSDVALLRRWKKNCLQHGNLFVGQNLPVDGGLAPILSHDLDRHPFDEINNPADYLRALKSNKDACQRR
jgi:choline kinase